MTHEDRNRRRRVGTLIEFSEYEQYEGLEHLYVGEARISHVINDV